MNKAAKPELLAPVGGWEALLAAMENGADAVYVGGTQFSARAGADNFDNETMARAVDYVHLKGGHIHVTVNTILDEVELGECLEYLRFLYATGVDAVIVQDLGLIRLARKVLPELELHASTQMTVHNLEGVRLMEELGFARAVLSREMSLENIRHIRDNSSMELETFIHGALCVCYSGECLMSSLIGGRSGNRGRCAQPCRMQYSLVDEKGNSLVEEGVGSHLLSTRDLNSIEFLPQLIEAGIRSFKIEGRMKRPEYVATVVRSYRQALDRAWDKPQEYQATTEEQKDLLQIFNRDFTPGYYLGNPGVDLMSYKRPNNRGAKLGRITGLVPGEKAAEVLLEEDLHLGDGLEIWVTQGGRQGFNVNSINADGARVEKAEAGQRVILDMPGRVSMGDRVFKTFAADLMARARKSFEAPKYAHKMVVTAAVTVEEGQPLSITLQDTAGNQGIGVTSFLAEQALKRPLSQDSIYKQLDRLGNTPFALGEVDIQITGEVMVPVSEINEARRQAVENLEKARLQLFERKQVSGKVWRERLSQAIVVGDESKVGKPGKAGQSLTVAVSCLDSLKAAVDNGADRVYLGAESFRHRKPVTSKEIQEGVEYCHSKGRQFVLSTPRILQDDQLQGYWPTAEKALQAGVDGVLLANLGLANLFRKAADNAKLSLMADFSLNIYNSQAMALLEDLGFNQVTLSPELTLEQIAAMGAKPATVDRECLVHGALPMMISDYCMVGCTLGGRKTGVKCKAPCQGKTFGLKDRLNYVFPMAMDQFCHLHLFNSKELCVVDDLGSLKEAGVSGFRLELKLKEAKEVGQITRIYRTQLDQLVEHRGKGQTVDQAKLQLEALSAEGLTKGHYYRGVI